MAVESTADERLMQSPMRRASGFLHRHRLVRLGGLLSLPMAWLVVVYLGSLAVLFAAAFWSIDSFSGVLTKTITLDNFEDVITDEFYRRVALRTVAVAAAVTVIDIVIAFPIAFAMAKVVRPRWRSLLVVLVLMPLWASYLVKAYAWRTILKPGGLGDSVLGHVGLSTPGFSLRSTVIVLAYLWLPYMILPIYAGLERLPDSLLEASGDLGATAGRTFRSVVLPLAFPSIVAGSIFTFSLSLGDYITVQLVGGPSQLLGNLIYDKLGTANDLPLAAALATIPVVVMICYLALVRRTGALDEL
jgi:putative spermidine/putrescine transport system permease protein